jgi:hypothetical protein
VFFGSYQKGFTFLNGETFNTPAAAPRNVCRILPVSDFSMCSAPEYLLLKYYGALHLLEGFGYMVSTNITGALHLASFVNFGSSGSKMFHLFKR